MKDNNIKIFVSVIIILVLGIIATIIIQSKSASISSKEPGKSFCVKKIKMFYCSAC